MLAIVTRTQGQAKNLQLRLLASCAMATSMISAGTTQAVATTPPPLTGAETAFQGIGTVVSGNATIVQTPTLDTITVSAPRTVINFTPFDTANGGGPITFLPSGRTGLFQNDPNSGVTDFTVLNRIIPTDATRAIRFDGTVQSRIANATGGSSPGGKILFYSPGGIIASSSAVFDVGSLVLSAADIELGEGDNSFSFRNATPGTTVDINNGASLLAQGTGSYVALVAPRIIQSGSVKSDGSIAYIAGEAVDVTIQNNLFDINFVQGTDGGAAVTHNGATELTRAPGDTSPQRIYVAAVPKNDAITTLISGSLGYTAATQATMQNGAVILTAGRNVTVDGPTDFAGSTAAANISIGSETSTIFNSSVVASATGDAVIAPAAGTTVQFANDVNLSADRLAEVRAVAGSSAIFDANLTVNSNNLVKGSAARVIATGEVGYGQGGSISVANNLTIDGGSGSTALGELTADLGTISVGGGTLVSASEDNSFGIVGNANATGGTAIARVGALGSRLSLTTLALEARAHAGIGLNENEAPVPGNAVGGTSALTLGGGVLNASTISLDSRATATPGGLATGGTAAISATGGTTLIGTITANVGASLASEQPQAGAPTSGFATNISGFAANAATMSTVTGGTIQLDVVNTTINVNGDLILDASAMTNDGNGGARGGTININVDNGSLLVGDTIDANASATESASSLGVTPAAVRGGNISASIINGGALIASAMSYQANADSGGDALGGTVSITTGSGTSLESTGAINLGAASVVRGLESGGNASGGNLTVNIGGSVQSGPLFLDASAVGGDAVLGGAGGMATGGTAQVNISGGDSTIEKFNLITDATGGRGGNGDEMIALGGIGGAATGGIAEVNMTGGTLRTAGFVITSGATGGSGGDATTGGGGGAALGGRGAVVTSEAASLFLMQRPTEPVPTPLASSIDASARGGEGGFSDLGNGGTGGVATGGTAHLTLAAANIQPETMPFAVNLRATSEANGGRGGDSNGANGGAGGSANGGTATINLINNNIDFGSVALSTRGSGGSGGSGANSGYGPLAIGGAGGNASAGAASVSIAAPAATLIATNIANLAIAAEAVGGSGGVARNGGAGGNAINTGSASFTQTSGMVTVPVAILTTNSFGGRGGLGLGGNGGAGGNSGGGVSRLTADGAAARLTVNVAGVTATARSGFGGDAQANPGTQGGNAGSATGGTAEILATNGATASLALTASADASALGGLGGIGLAGGGSGGNATGGTSRIDGTNGKVDAALLSLSSNGVGGTGGQAGYGGLADATVAGGNGGSGTGGSATLANIRFASVDAAVDVTADGNGGSGGRGPSGGNGGAATGGSSSFISNNQTNTLGTVFVSAEANGGFGANGTGVFGSLGGNGGAANGGTATISISGGALTTAFATTRANAGGGNGGFGYRAGNGGNAIGGTAQFSALAGTTAQIGTLELSARADGGLGASGANGIQEAATIAEATGGTGGNGGNGSGGSALLTSSGATTRLTVSELITETIGTGAGGGSGGAGGITIDAMAGAGGDGGAGGAGVGGTINIAINGGTAQINAGRKGSPVTIAAGGFGGLGGNGGEGGGNETVIGASGINGANGNATGGNGNIAVSSAQLSSPNIRFDSDGRGPGNVAGGNAAFSVSNGGTFVGNSLVMTADALGLRRNDQVAPVKAGERAAAVPVASATGGVVSVNIADSTAVLTETLDLSANAEARLAAAQGGTVNIFATGGTLTTPSTFVTANGSSFVAGTEIGGRGGNINIRAERPANGAAGVLNLGSTDLEASGFSVPNDDGDAITNAAAGRISIAAIGGQTTATNFSTLSAKTLGRNSGGFDPNKGIFLNADQGGIITNGAVSLLSDESIGVSAISTGNVFVGNDLSAEARNNITVSHSGRSANANTILAANVSLIADNDVSANPGSRIRSDNDLSITAIASRSSSVSAGDLVAGDDITVNANSLINITGLAQTTGITAMDGESDIAILTPGGVTVNMVDAFGNFRVNSASLLANGTINAGEDVNLLTTGAISTQAISAGDDVLATTGSGNISILSATARGTGPDDEMGDADVVLNSTSGTIGVGAGRATDDIIIKTAGNIIANDLATARVSLGIGTNRSDIIIDSGADVSIDTINAQSSLAVRGASITSSNLTAGEDIALSASGNISATTALAGDDFSALSSGGNITLTGITTNATGLDDRTVNLGYGEISFGASAANGSRIDANAASGDINFDLLNSSGATSLIASRNIVGGSASAGGLLTVNALSTDIDSLTSRMDSISVMAQSASITNSNAAVDLFVSTGEAPGTSITLGTGVAARDIRLIGGTNGISATSLTAGDDIDIVGAGTVSVTNALTTGGFNNGYGEDLSDIIIDAADEATLGTINANASLAIRAASLVAGSLTAGEDIAVLTSGTASVTTASTGDDIDVTSTGSAITLGSLTTTGLGADDRRVSFGPESIGFGEETFARSNILVNAAGDLSVTSATARDTLGLRTDSVLSAGTLVAGEDATFASSGATTLMSVMAGDDIDATAGGAITIRSAMSTGSGADDRQVLLPGGSAFFIGERLARSNIVALSGSNVTLGNPPSAAMPEISAAATLAVRAAGMINASNIAAGEDIALSATGNIAVGTASAGDDFTASAAIGDITLGTITTRGTGLDDRSVDFGGIALGFLATPANGSRIDANAGYGNVNLATLNSADATSLMAGGSVLGGTSTADGLLSVMADSIDVDGLTSSGSSVNASARLVDIGSASAGLDIIVDTKGLTNSSITLGTATAERDIRLTGGTNGISATSLTAGDDIDIIGTGTVTITNALTTGSFNSGYGGDLSNITINAGSDAMLDTLRARDNLTVTSVDSTAATMLTADRGTILVNGGTAATITNATATLGAVTLNADRVDATTVNANTDVNVNFGASALLGTVTAGNAINVTGTGNASFTSLTSGGATSIMAGGSVLGGTSTAGGVLSVMADSIDVDALTSTGSSVTASARLVDIGTANAGLDIIINTKGLPNGSIRLGTATAARDISLTAGVAGGFPNPGAMASVFATSLTAGDDIDVFATNNVNIGSALTNGSFNSGYGSDPSNITISTSFMGRADLTNGRAKDNLTISTGIGGANSSGSLIADRGDILVNGQMSANIAQATATVGSVTLNAAFVNAGTVSAGTDANVNFFVSGNLGTVTAARDVIVTGSGPATLSATSLVAGDDIVVTTGGNATITSARAGSTLRNTSASLTATTLNAGTDLIVLTDMAAGLGTASAGARIVTNAGTSIAFTQLMSGTTTSLTAGTSIAGGNANAGTTLSLNANGGAIGFGALTSGGSTTITASNAIMGNSAAAGGALTLNSGANGITATSLSSGNGSNLTVTASNGGNAAVTTATSGLDLSVNANNVSVVTGTAARDVLFTAANNIVAGTTDAGRTVALNAVGTINANTTTAVGDILASSSGNASLVTSTADNIFVVSTGDATLGNASAKTMIGVNAKNVSGTTLTAVEDIRLIASGTANVTTATAGDDFDVSASGDITLGNITVTGAARDDRSLLFNAPAFAVVASPADGSDIRLTSNGAISAANLDAGDDIRIGGGNVMLTGLAKTRGLGVTDTGSDVVINGNAVSVAMIDAASNLAVNSESFAGTSLNAARAITIMTSENQSLGTATATQGPITGTSVRGTISFVDLSTGGDISLTAGNAIAGGNANAGGSIQLAATNGVNFGGLTSGGLINIGGASVSGGNISADGDVFVSGDLINLGSVSSNFASIFLAGRDVTVGTAGARFDFTVDTSKPANSRIALGDVTVGRDILLTGAANGLTATSLMAGDDIDIDITGNAKIGIAITDGSFNGGYGDHGDEAITARVRNDGYGDWGYGDWGYGSDLSNITLGAAQAMIGTAQARDNVTLTTMTGTMAGTVIAERGDILVNGGTSANIMQSTATLGSITINADAVTADQASAGNAFSVNFLRNASLGTVNAGSTISLTGSGDASLMSLTSGGATAIMAGGSVTGGTSTAGGLLSVMADSIDVDSLTSTGSDVTASARLVDIGTTSAARDALIDTKGLANSSITLGSVNASRDIQLTGGTNGITATSLTAGDDIDVIGAGNVNITTATATGSFNSGYGALTDPSNLSVTANSGMIMLGNGRAKDNITLTTTGGATAASLTADRGAILVNGGASANIMQSTAALGSITINADAVTADQASAGNAFTVNFLRNASLGTVNAGSTISLTGAGDASLMSLTSGGATAIMAGGSVTGGTSTAGDLLSVMADSIDVDSLTSTGSDVTASARLVDIGTTSAARDALIDTKGLANSSITLGSVIAARDVGLTGATNGISATSLTAGDDIDVVGSGSVSIANALTNGAIAGDASNITLSAATQAMLGTIRAKDNLTVTTVTGTTATNLTSDRGAILLNGGTSATIDQATSTLGSVTINADTISATGVTAATDANFGFGTTAALGSVRAGGTINMMGIGDIVRISRRDVSITDAIAGLDVIIDTGGLANSSIALGSVTATRDISLSGATNGLSATMLTAGDDIDVAAAGNATLGSLRAGDAITATSVGSLTTTGPVNAGSTVNFAGRSITTANVSSGTTTTLAALNGTLSTGNVTAGTGVTLTASDTITTGALTATANNVAVTATNGMTLGSASAANNIVLTNSNNLLTTGALTAGNDISVTNGGAINLTSASAADDVRVTGGAITVGAVSTRGGADMDGDGNDIVIRATGPVSLMSATTQTGALATSDVSLTSTAGSVNLGTATARGAITATAATGLTAGSATSGTNIALTGQTINATTLTAATNIMATSSGAMTIGDARAMGGNVSLTAAGALSAMNATATGDVRLTSSNGGNISTGTLSSGSGDIVITSDGNATMTGNSSAGRNLNVTARNLISVGGVANGTAIDLRSTDIMVNTTSGRIGEQGRTTVAQLTNTGTGVTTIGGAGVTTGYSLSNAEAQRIFAGDIIITAARTATTPAGTQALQTLNAAAPDVVLDALTLTGATGQTGATGGNIGATGRLRIETPGKLRTVGAVAISNLATANRFQVNAAQSIEVDAATGSISLSGAGSTLGGTIELTAPSVIAASLTAIGAVAAAVDGRAINDRLAINDNAISDVGAFSANAIIANVSDGFFVQNSGIKELSAFSFGDRRGITVGAGGLTINAASPATRIFVSGRQLQPNGSFITGIDFLRAQTINGTRIQLSTFPPTPFDPASTVNGCAIITASTCLVTIDGGSLARDVVGQSDDDGGGSSEGSGNSGNDFVRFEFKSLDASTFAPVIDDPVTGVGNDDLYALYDARDCNDDQSLESCAKPE
jgi:hypothetical protein